MRTTPITIPIIPIMLMTSDKNENTVFDPPGPILTGISGVVEMFDSRDLIPVRFSDRGDAVSIFSRGAMHVSW